MSVDDECCEGKSKQGKRFETARGGMEDCALNRTVREVSSRRSHFIKNVKAAREWYLEEELSRTRRQNVQRHWGGSTFGVLQEQQRGLWAWSRVSKCGSGSDELRDGGGG